MKHPDTMYKTLRY